MGGNYRIIILPEAANDLIALHGFIARDTPSGASHLVERILKSIELLKIAPHRTVVEHQDSRIKSPVRSLPVRPCVVFFRVNDDERVVHILTIRHGSRLRPAFE